MEISGKTIIVTGGAGFIGSNIVDILSKHNKVIVIDNMFTGTARNLRSAFKTGNVRLVKADAMKISDIKAKPDIILHLGMYSSTPMYKEDNFRVSSVVSGNISVFKFALKHDADVVFTSSSSIYNGYKPPHREDMPPKVTDFYTEGRVYAERLAELYNRLYGLNATGLRLFSVYGKHEENKKQYANLVTQFIWAIKRNQKPVIYGDGSQTRDFTYVSDVANAFILASRKKGFDIFNVGTGKNYSLNELVHKLGMHIGRKVTPRYISQPIKNYVMYTLADTSKSEKKLGFKARYTLDMGIDELLDYYKIRKAQK